MKRLLLITLLVLSSGPAYAEWVLVTTGAESETAVYTDPDTIRRKGELVKMWELYDLKTVKTVVGTSYLSIKVQAQYDCADERKRRLSSTAFAGNMATGDISLIDDEVQKWRLVPPGSVVEALWAFACSKQ